MKNTVVLSWERLASPESWRHKQDRYDEMSDELQSKRFPPE